MDLFQVLKKQKTNKQVQTSVQKLLEEAHSDSTGQQDLQQHHQFYPERLSCYSFTRTISQIPSYNFILSFHLLDFIFHRCFFLGFSMQPSQPHHENTHRFISSSAFCRIWHLYSCYFHSKPKPISSPHHIFFLLFSWVPKEMGRRKTSSSKTSSFQGCGQPEQFLRLSSFLDAYMTGQDFKWAAKCWNK